jgi:tetratricopeptide (TPR) repeat protein
MGAIFLAMRAQMQGRFAEAERLASEALALGQRASDALPLASYGGIMLHVWQEQGRATELEGVAKTIVKVAAGIPAAQTVVASTALEPGRIDEARAAFEQLAVDDFTQFPHDFSWLGVMARLASVCAALGDARRAIVLYRLLVPYEGRNIVSLGGPCSGPASHHLGLLAATAGRLEDAAAHFEDALAMSTAMGARPFLAHSQIAYADTLLRLDRPGDRERARALVDQARATAEELGMRPLVDKASALQRSLSP